MFYGLAPTQDPGKDTKYTAIIDTGSSNIGVPDSMFQNLKKKWQTDIKDLDCVTDDNFCQVMTPCE